MRATRTAIVKRTRENNDNDLDAYVCVMEESGWAVHSITPVEWQTMNGGTRTRWTRLLVVMEMEVD